MTCARGCCATQAEHYRSVSVAATDRRGATRTTTDDHGTHAVDVTEHWTDRQDVLVRAPHVRATLSTQEHPQPPIAAPAVQDTTGMEA